MRQRIDAGDGEREVWIILVGEPQARRLNAKTEARRVTVKWFVLGRRIEELELVEAQDALVDLSCLLARTYDFNDVTERRDDEHLDGLRQHRSADDNARLQFSRVHLTPTGDGTTGDGWSSSPLKTSAVACPPIEPPKAAAVCRTLRSSCLPDAYLMLTLAVHYSAYSDMRKPLIHVVDQRFKCWLRGEDLNL